MKTGSGKVKKDFRAQSLEKIRAWIEEEPLAGQPSSAIAASEEYIGFSLEDRKISGCKLRSS